MNRVISDPITIAERKLAKSMYARKVRIADAILLEEAKQQVLSGKEPSTAGMKLILKEQKRTLYFKQYYSANKSDIASKIAKKYKDNYKDMRTKGLVRSTTVEAKEGRRRRAKSSSALLDKLSHYRAADTKAGRDNNITSEFILCLIDAQDERCTHCNDVLNMSWTIPYDPKQFSINRLNNKLGHIQGNCEVTCLICNREYGNR